MEHPPPGTLCPRGCAEPRSGSLGCCWLVPMSPWGEKWTERGRQLKSSRIWDLLLGWVPPQCPHAQH